MDNKQKIKNLFKKLSKREQSLLLKDLTLVYQNQKSRKSKTQGKPFVKRIRDEISSTHNSSPPRNINNSTLNLIIVEAINAGVDEQVIAQLEKIAYRGLIKWANSYGYMSEQDEDFAVEHLEKFIEITGSIYKKSKQKQLFKKEQLYLQKNYNDNFYSECILETFEALAGLKIQ